MSNAFCPIINGLAPRVARLVVELTGRRPLSGMQIINGFATAIVDIKPLKPTKQRKEQIMGKKTSTTTIPANVTKTAKQSTAL